MPRLLAPSAGAAWLVLLAGCGGSGGGVDQEELKAGIVSDLARTGARVRDVTCEEVEPEVGARVACTAVNQADTALRFEGKVTSVDEDGKRLRFAGTVVGGIAKGTAAAKQARQIIEQQADTRVRSVTCPDRIEIPTTTPATCTTTTLQGEVYDTSVAFDAKGTLRTRVADEPRG